MNMRHTFVLFKQIFSVCTVLAQEGEEEQKNMFLAYLGDLLIIGENQTLNQQQKLFQRCIATDMITLIHDLGDLWKLLIDSKIKFKTVILAQSYDQGTSNMPLGTCTGGYSNHTDSRFVREEGKLMSDICLSLLGKGQSALELCNALIILCASLVRIDPRTNQSHPTQQSGTHFHSLKLVQWWDYDCRLLFLQSKDHQIQNHTSPFEQDTLWRSALQPSSLIATNKQRGFAFVDAVVRHKEIQSIQLYLQQLKDQVN
ncbi:MAG: hypothetical protein EZS28_001020 [Streblomastix strix]|uniref:Reverse transcriptase domain-containing protein n=1 Tax=Streblomastix strix TaxID=222440 RepID=A0A5J4X865_9EUKA|nr:MAG: hypothetical protein EZS28_001020 [Streblomastix strix]